jgi:ABC-2 type transport system permease protein
MPDIHPAARQARLPGVWPVLARQVGYQLRLLARNPRAIYLSVLVPGLLLAVRAGRLGHATPAQDAVLAAAVGGCAMFGILATSYVTHAAGLVTARQDAVLRRWRASPLPAGGYFAARIAATALVANASGVVVVIVGVAMTHLTVTAGAALSLLAVFTLASLAWAAVGTAASIAVPTPDAAFPLLGFTSFPIMILSGMFGTIGTLPSWLVTVLRYLPAQPVIDAITQVLRHTNGGLAPIPPRDVAVLAAWTAAGLLVSARFFRWDPRRPSHARPSHTRPGSGLPASRSDPSVLAALGDSATAS